MKCKQPRLRFELEWPCLFTRTEKITPWLHPPRKYIYIYIYIWVRRTLGEWRPASRKSRREQVVISRLRIGHTRLTHSFILKQEPRPQCLTCQTTCTVKHILIECRSFAVIRKRFFKVNNLTDLFENVKIDDILSFLRETDLYQKICQLKTG